MGILSLFKDKATSTLLKTFANSLVADYGRLDNIDLDSSSKNINISMFLKGEKENISIEIADYEVVKSKNQNFIQLHNVKTSREWLNIVLDKYFIDRRIEIPKSYIGIVKLLL
jgi:hypothetical protein